MKNTGWAARLCAFVAATVVAIGFAGSVFAQDPTPTEQAFVTHPAHIHKGSCADLDPNPAFPLDNVGPRLKDDELPPPEDVKGSMTVAPVEVSETEDVEVKFDDLFTEAYAINLHESDQNVQNYIACGDIGGPVIDDKVFIGLAEQNGSGYAGIAIIEKDGDDHVKVTIYLTRGLGGAAPVATPTS
jgi:hypothetical protein